MRDADDDSARFAAARTALATFMLSISSAVLLSSLATPLAVSLTSASFVSMIQRPST